MLDEKDGCVLGRGTARDKSLITVHEIRDEFLAFEGLEMIMPVDYSVEAVVWSKRGISKPMQELTSDAPDELEVGNQRESGWTYGLASCVDLDDERLQINSSWSGPESSW